MNKENTTANTTTNNTKYIIAFFIGAIFTACFTFIGLEILAKNIKIIICVFFIILALFSIIVLFITYN
jgi:hypothetical protein